MIDIDQSPIGRTPRSNPATYTGVFDHVRPLFAATTEARVRGYQPGRFSFNVKGGRCEACAGDGTIKIEMHFLPDVYVPCEVCRGKRYNRETLEVHYKGHTIADVLDMSVEEALGCFDNHPEDRPRPGDPVRRRPRLHPARPAGADAVRAARPSGSSWPAELAKRSTGRTLYILDEPTTGLHFEDISQAPRGAAPAGRRRQHGGRDRAQPRRDQDGRLGDRPRPRGRPRRRRGRRPGPARSGSPAPPAPTPGSSWPSPSARNRSPSPTPRPPTAPRPSDPGGRRRPGRPPRRRPPGDGRPAPSYAGPDEHR